MQPGADWRLAYLSGRLVAVAAVLLCTATPVATAQPPLPLEQVADMPLPGPAARFDYQSLDPSRQRLYIAHMGAGRVLAVDLGKRAVQVVADMPDVHGVLVVPELGRVYATVTARNEVVAIDPATLEILATAPTGRYPDGMAYAPRAQKLFVSNEFGRSVTVIDTRTHRRLDTIALGGEVGNTQYDPVSEHVFANVQSTGELVEIDPVSHKLLTRLRLEGTCSNHGLYIEPDRHLAFVACEDSARLLVIDLTARAQIAAHAVGAGPDVLAFDPALRLLYVAAESGIVSMFRLAGKALVALGEQQLAPAAHSVAVNPHSHEIYFPLKNIEGRPLLRVMRPTRDLF